MASIGDLLGKYKEQIERNTNERAKIAEIVSEASGVNFTEKEVEFETGRLTLRAHPAKRQIAFMRKIEILSALQSQLPDKRILTIN